MFDLLDQLETLRIHESDFFAISPARRLAYQRANEMLDDCIEIVYQYLKDAQLVSY